MRDGCGDGDGCGEGMGEGMGDGKGDGEGLDSSWALYGWSRRRKRWFWCASGDGDGDAVGDGEAVTAWPVQVPFAFRCLLFPALSSRSCAD